MMIKNDWRFPSVGWANWRYRHVPPLASSCAMLRPARTSRCTFIHTGPTNQRHAAESHGVWSRLRSIGYSLTFLFGKKRCATKIMFFNRLGARGRNVLRNHNLKNSVPTCCVTSSSKNYYYIRNDSWAETQDYLKKTIFFWPWEILFKNWRYPPTGGARQSETPGSVASAKKVCPC